MGHCVGSYNRACINGGTSILSLKKIDGNSSDRLTIEVSKRRNEIVQIKGRYNRRPTNSEMFVVDQFAIKNNLGIGRYAA